MTQTVIPVHFLIFNNFTFLILAEFIIYLSEKNNTFESFKKVLLENGANFSVRIKSI